MAKDDRFVITPNSGDDGFEFPPAKAALPDTFPPSFIHLARHVILHAINVMVVGPMPRERDHDSPQAARAFLMNDDGRGDIIFWCKIARWPVDRLQQWVRAANYDVAVDLFKVVDRRHDYSPIWALFVDASPIDVTDVLAAAGISHDLFRPNIACYARANGFKSKTWRKDGRQWAQLTSLVEVEVATKRCICAIPGESDICPACNAVAEKEAA